MVLLCKARTRASTVLPMVLHYSTDQQGGSNMPRFVAMRQRRQGRSKHGRKNIDLKILLKKSAWRVFSEEVHVYIHSREHLM